MVGRELGATLPVTGGGVYIVEPVDEERQRLVDLLGALPGEMRIYASAEEFLEDLEPMSVGCVVTSVELPGMGGVRFLDCLRQRRAAFSVIVLTRDHRVASAVDMMRSGVQCVLEKPYVGRVLVEEIQHSLRRTPAMAL